MPASDKLEPEELIAPAADEDEGKDEDSKDKKKKQPASKAHAAKIFKQHLEICKLKTELTNAIKEKEDLETEVKERSEEMYKMNERMIMMEFQTKQQEQLKFGGEFQAAQLNELRSHIDQMRD